MWVSLAVCAVTSLILKFSWYNKLGPGEMYLPNDLMAGRAQPLASDAQGSMIAK
jgi:hypothetical protein